MEDLSNRYRFEFPWEDLTFMVVKKKKKKGGIKPWAMNFLVFLSGYSG